MCSPNAALPHLEQDALPDIVGGTRLTLTRPEVAALPHSAAHVPSKLPSPVYTL